MTRHRLTRLSLLLVSGLLAVTCISIISPSISAIADQSQKFATTQKIRAGMEKIRKEVVNVHTLVTHRRLPKAMALAFSQSVSKHVESISDQSDQTKGSAELHNILQDIKNGAEGIAGERSAVSSIDGLLDITEALSRYSTMFEHKGWKPLRDY